MSTKPYFQIENLSSKINEKIILSQVSLSIAKGEKHVLMGPNGSGKSSLAKIIAGYPFYTLTSGTIYLNNRSLLELTVPERAQAGVFLSFQSPPAFPGLMTYDFLQLIFQIHKNKKKRTISPLQFLKRLRLILQEFPFKQTLLSRDLNQNFSGGERKLNEVLQILLLKPSFLILDEIDSGLDIDAIKLIFKIFLSAHFKTTTFLIITHNPTLLFYIQPTLIHLLVNGQIIKTGSLHEIQQVLTTTGYTKLDG